jgi:hypothetical protein
MHATTTKTKTYNMKAMSIEAIELANKNTGYMIDSSLNMTVNEGIEMLEIALQITRHALNEAAKIQGHASANEAPKDWIKTLTLSEVIAVTSKSPADV